MPSSCGTGSSASPENGVSYVAFFHPLVTHLRCPQIWKTTWTPVKVAYLFCRCVKIVAPPISMISFTSSIRYWVIVVVPYLLYAFVTNHTQEVCEKIYKVSSHCRPNAMPYLRHFAQIPVALAMWNQVGSECQSFFLPTIQFLIKENTSSRFAHSYICFLQPQRVPSSGTRLCPSRRGCIPALRGCVTNDTSVKSKCVSVPWLFTLRIVLAFVTPPYVSEESAKLNVHITNSAQGPCFPASKPHSAHLLGNDRSYRLDNC